MVRLQTDTTQLELQRTDVIFMPSLCQTLQARRPHTVSDADGGVSIYAEGNQPQSWVSECACQGNGHYHTSLGCDIFGRKILQGFI